MPYFVRCIEGHVFDADISPQCPTCGAFVDVPTPLPATAAPSQPATKSPILASPGASIAATQTNAPPMGAAILGRLSGSVLLIVLISALLGIAGSRNCILSLPASQLAAAVRATNVARPGVGKSNGVQGSTPSRRSNKTDSNIEN